MHRTPAFPMVWMVGIGRVGGASLLSGRGNSTVPSWPLAPPKAMTIKISPTPHSNYYITHIDTSILNEVDNQKIGSFTKGFKRTPQL